MSLHKQQQSVDLCQGKKKTSQNS